MKLAITKYPGGKTYQLKGIYSLFKLARPVCSHLIDGCVGGGSVPSNQTIFPSDKIIINDLNYAVCATYESFKNQETFSLLKLALLHTDYNEENFKIAQKIYHDENGWKSVIPHLLSWSTIVAHRFSRNSQTKDYSWSERLRGGQPENINAWENYLKTLDMLHGNIQHYRIHNLNILELLQKYNESSYLIFLDPPYLPETRISKKLYTKEMSPQEHSDMLDLVISSKAKIIMCGRPSQLYDYRLREWQNETKMLTNSMSQKKVKRKCKECLWWNF